MSARATGKLGGTTDLIRPLQMQEGVFMSLFRKTGRTMTFPANEIFIKREDFTMKEKLEQIKAQALAQIEASDALDKLNEVRVNVLGKRVS